MSGWLATAGEPPHGRASSLRATRLALAGCLALCLAACEGEVVVQDAGEPAAAAPVHSTPLPQRPAVPLRPVTARGAARAGGAQMIAPAVVAQPEAMLSLVPAETPYAWATLPAPEAGDAVELDDFAPFYDTFANALVVGLDPDSHADTLLRALVDELRGHYSADGLAALGIAPRPRLVVFGLGLAPVLRLELTDPLKASVALDRIERRADLPAERKRFEAFPYRTWALDGWTLLAAVTPNELIVAMLPVASVEGALPLLFGTAAPPRSLASEAVLEPIAAAGNGPAVRAAGFVSPAGLLAALREHPAGSLRELFDALGVPASMHGACSQDLTRIAALVPRVEFVSGADASAQWGSFTVELADPALAERLRKLRVPTIGLGHHAWSAAALAPDGGADAEMPNAFLGVALDLPGLGAWLDEIGEAVAEQPFGCTTLLNLNALVASTRAWWRARPEMLRAARGLYGIATHTGLGRRGISRLEGVLVLGARDPKRFWSKLTEGTPLDVRLERDRVRKLPAAAQPAMFTEVTVRPSGSALVLTSGAGMAARSDALLGLGPDAPAAADPESTLVAELGYDYGRLMSAYFEATPQDAERLAAKQTRASVMRLGLFRLDLHVLDGALRLDYRLDARPSVGQAP